MVSVYWPLDPVTTTSTSGEKDEPLELTTPYEALPSLVVATGTPWAD